MIAPAHHAACVLVAQRGFDHATGGPWLRWHWECHEDCQEQEQQTEREKPMPEPEEGARAPFVVDRDLGDETEGQH